MPFPFILFPCYPTQPRKVDPAFAEEFEAAQDSGFQVGLIGLDDPDVSLTLPVVYTMRGLILGRSCFGLETKTRSKAIDLITSLEERSS